jgi:hypothetical protein
MGIVSKRADHFTEPGRITDQMIAAILDYDLCVADLSGQNANVFYELAIEQAAEQPVVLLLLAGEPIPFDVKDYRRLEYDMKPRSFMTNKWIPELKKQLASVLAADYRPPRLLGGKSILKSGGFRSYLINARSEEFGDAPRFHEVVEKAEKYCCLMGISLKTWGSTDGERVLLDLAARRLPVKVLIMHAENPGLAAMINSDLPSEDLEAARRQTERTASYFEGMAGDDAPSFEVRRLRKGLPHFQLIITEETALVLQYMFGRGTADSPLQQFPCGSQLHRAFLDEFDKLWTLNDGERARDNKKPAATAKAAATKKKPPPSRS